jgi:hypothetical protein
MSVRLVKPTVHSGTVQRGDLPFNDLGILAEPIELPGEGVLLSPPPADLRPSLDAPAAYQRAERQGGPSSTRPTVALALGIVRPGGNWDDGGLAERLVYVVRWDNVNLRFYGPPRRDGRPHGPAVGTRTGIVDAATGAGLLHVEGT